MVKLTLIASLAFVAAPLNFAYAIGGSDVAAHIRDLNAACDAQRRGELAPNPSYCLPELPLFPDTPPARGPHRGY